MATSSPASRIQANLKELFKANLAPGDAYIRFQLTSDMTALLSMEQVQESLIVEAEKITPLFSMPESVIGIMSSRNRVFCVFDLAQLLNLPPQLIAPQEYQIIVLQTTSEQPIYIGLAVTRLQGIVRLPREQIQLCLDAFPSNIAPCLCGAVQEQETMIPVLEFNSISEALTTINNS
jgi:positive phototaxis protein PixI